ncbi:MAG: 3-phosphoserine/phosphohydroxythreonine transaminase [Pseudomonadales bacterium]|jgi:phosphoserine aminotransferase|nr:3-phosphoserine/phosphohydroxythreonine transaminase [Pseudomonadales bacterium]
MSAQPAPGVPHRIHNFSAGPAALPQPVLERARAELLDYRGTGMSVMEMSHRGEVFVDVAERAERDLRRLLGIGDDFAVLFLQGGATSQFAAVPLNLTAGPDDLAVYVHTGAWSSKAIAEAKRYARVHVAASAEDRNFSYVPSQEHWDVPAGARYVHVCTNETIGGVEFPFTPETGDVPLVGDFSSTILSRPLAVDAWDVLYAGAQKNIGPAGLALVIVRRELLGRARAETPAMLDWAVHAEHDSMYNTPPTFAWYLAGLVFEWLLELGGLEAMAAINRRKAETLYAAIDGSNFYASPVDPACRSWMNVPFTLADPALDARFLEEAEARGLANLKGHRSVGGMRASLYNAVGQDAVDALVAFMGEFERTHG